MGPYFLIGSLSMESADPDDEWYESVFLKKFPCGHRPDYSAMNVIVSNADDSAALNGVCGPCVDYARADFLERLHPSISKYLDFGYLYDRAGRVFSNFRTIGSRAPLCIRGDRESSRSFCDHCELFLYYAMGRPYVLRESLTGQPVYLGTQGGIVIDHETRAKFDETDWRNVCVSEL